MEMKEKILNSLTHDFVEKRDNFKIIKNEIEKIAKKYDDNGIDISYDEFCKRFLNNFKKKDIDPSDDMKKIRKFELESAIEIAINELLERKNYTGAKIILNAVKEMNYD
jgi:hypothetical protein